MMRAGTNYVIGMMTSYRNKRRGLQPDALRDRRIIETGLTKAKTDGEPQKADPKNVRAADPLQR